MISAGKRKRKAQQGMTMIELIMAMTMLAAGLVGVLALILAGMTGNHRNKLDTSGTMLAERVIDVIVSQPASAGTTVTMPDCNPAGATNWLINTAPNTSAALDATTGNIDFNAAYSGVADGYKMQFVTCGANGGQITYEVRWNIEALPNGFSKKVVVGARPLGGTANGTTLFAPPVTLRTIAAS